jgi:hypothetical protein
MHRAFRLTNTTPSELTGYRQWQIWQTRNCKIFRLTRIKRSCISIRDALPDETAAIDLAWLQLHAEDEFAGGAFGSAKFDRIAVMNGTFRFKMVLEGASNAERNALEKVLELARAGQIGIGGGQWRGHGWVRWTAIPQA